MAGEGSVSYSYPNSPWFISTVHTRHISCPWRADECNRHYIIQECTVEAAVVLDVPSYATSTMYPDPVLAKASGYAGRPQQYSADVQ